MRNHFEDLISIPEVTVTIPIDKQVSKILQGIFDSKIGALKLNLSYEEHPELVISCFTANEINDNTNSTNMYTVEENRAYKQLKKIVTQIVDDYFALEDEKILESYKQRELEEFEYEQKCKEF